MRSRFILRKRRVSARGVAVAFVLAMTGCGRDSPETDLRLGDEGESCRTTSDCKAGVVCIANVCVTDPGDSADGDVRHRPAAQPIANASRRSA